MGVNSAASSNLGLSKLKFYSLFSFYSIYLDYAIELRQIHFLGNSFFNKVNMSIIWRGASFYFFPFNLCRLESSYWFCTTIVWVEHKYHSSFKILNKLGPSCANVFTKKASSCFGVHHATRDVLSYSFMKQCILNSIEFNRIIPCANNLWSLVQTLPLPYSPNHFIIIQYELIVVSGSWEYLECFESFMGCFNNNAFCFSFMNNADILKLRLKYQKWITF